MSSYVRSSDFPNSVETASSTSPFPSTRGYGLISFLGLAQRLNVKFLPNRWMTGLQLLGNRGHGGQATILETPSLAFKRFKPRNPYYDDQGDRFQEPVNELIALKSDTIHKHAHMTQLKGLCWDFAENNKVYPVFVFDMSSLGDLYYFASAGEGQNMAFNERLQLCVDIGLALRSLHSVDIVHGDVKPRNVIIFESDQRYIAKVNDFGFATMFLDERDAKAMPRSPIWSAPEWHDRSFLLDAAKKMDVFSFGMLCLWLLSDIDLAEDVPSYPEWTNPPGQFISFDERRPLHQNCFELWKLQHLDNFIPLAAFLVNQQTGSFGEETARGLLAFFKHTLSIDPNERSVDWELLISLLDSTRQLPLLEPKDSTLKSPEEQEEFSILLSASTLYIADFRLRMAIASELQSIISEPIGPVVQRISQAEAAMQLAICHRLGFGIAKNDAVAYRILKQWSLAAEDLDRAIEYFKHCVSYYSQLGRASIFHKPEEPAPTEFDHRSYYQNQGVIEEAERQYARELRDLEEAVGHDHEICSVLKSFLANLLARDRHQETSELMEQVVEERRAVLGLRHPETWKGIETLAVAYQMQGRHEEEEKILLDIIDPMLDYMGLGEDGTDQRALRHMNYLAGSRRARDRLSESEELYLRVVQESKERLGENNEETVNRMAGLSSLYLDQERWQEMETLVREFLQVKWKYLGTHHPELAKQIAEWLQVVILFSNRWDASAPPIQGLELIRRVLGEELASEVFVILARADHIDETDESSIYQYMFGDFLGEDRISDFLSKRSN
ncbi:kinase-like protein [Periconia macrospinosa]|uniref:Kinase-like protein n=1 Tax=Periconia macrospinosa TaxID=97972 RepID=A0A2V1ECH9_9PLEO|nr:kinase-like protein [Periconia macrospinosa]